MVKQFFILKNRCYLFTVTCYFCYLFYGCFQTSLKDLVNIQTDCYYYNYLSLFLLLSLSSSFSSLVSSSFDVIHLGLYIRRSVKSGFRPADLQSFGGLCETADEEKLFNQVLYNPIHVLHQLLPRQSTAQPELQPQTT